METKREPQLAALNKSNKYKQSSCNNEENEIVHSFSWRTLSHVGGVAMKSTQSVCRFSKSSSIAKLGTIIAESYLRDRERSITKWKCPWSEQRERFAICVVWVLLRPLVLGPWLLGLYLCCSSSPPLKKYIKKNQVFSYLITCLNSINR